MGFQLSPGIKGCSDVVKAKLFFIPLFPCISITKNNRLLLISALWSNKTEEKGVAGREQVDRRQKVG